SRSRASHAAACRKYAVGPKGIQPFRPTSPPDLVVIGAKGIPPFAHIDQQRRSLRRLLAQLLKLDYRDSSGEWVRLKVPCEQSLIKFDDGSIGASAADQVRTIGTARQENRTRVVGLNLLGGQEPAGSVGCCVRQALSCEAGIEDPDDAA